jgi:CRP-like cAMP-binding protein
MDWILKQAQQILRGLSHLFTTQFFVIGGKNLSLSSIVVLILLALAVFIVSHFISEGIKRGLLVRMGMSRLELRRLIEYGYRQLFPTGQIVCQENDPGDSFYIILSGSVEVFSQRTEKYIATLHAGEFFGEMSLLLGTPRSATVRTLEDSILFVVCHNDLQQLLVEHQDLADEIAQKLSERQQVLRNLGLLDEGASEETPFIRIRKQIQTLFGI